MKHRLPSLIVLILSLLFLEACSKGFYGKVIDQQEKPVPGVDILYMAGLGSIISGGPRYGHSTTDTNGMFFIESPRGFLDFREMKKEGYQIALYRQVRLFESHESQPANVLYTDYSKGNPYIFHAWKYSDNFNKDKLIHDECTVYFKSDGTEYAIDLFGAPVQDLNEDLSNSQLKVRFFREPESNSRNRGPWQLVLTALNGGIIETRSLYTNKAPIKGYKESIILTHDDYKNTGYGVFKSYYIKMKEDAGTIYARLSFRLGPYFQDDNGIIQAKYTINPTGKRYLDTYDF